MLRWLLVLVLVAVWVVGYATAFTVGGLLHLLLVLAVLVMVVQVLVGGRRP